DNIDHPAQVFDACVGAAADEDVINRSAEQRYAGLKTHIFERLPEGSLLIDVFEFLNGRDAVSNLDPHSGICSVGDHGCDIAGIELEHLIIFRTFVGCESAPLFHQFFELLSLGGILPATDVVEGRVIGCDETAACAHLDTHVTDGHACLHGQAADGLAGVLNKIARGSARGYPGDDVQDDVFRYDALAQRTVDLDPHGFRTMLKDTLRGQHLLNFAGSYTKCDRAKGTVSRGVAVATYDRHTGQGQPKFRADNVYDALVRMAQAIQRNAELFAVLFQRLHLVA